MADYPISNVPRRVQYVNSGVGPYAFTFAVLVQTDIAVYRGTTLLTLTTDYTVVINANGTGSVTLVAAGTGNITIVGARAIQRSSDYTTGGDLFASTLNVDLDSQTIFSQQLAESVDRSIKAPITDASTLNLELPNQVTRANKYLYFDSNGAIAVAGLGSFEPSAMVHFELNGDGTETDFVIPVSTFQASVIVSINGVHQRNSSYTITGDDLVFTEAPPVNSVIEVVVFSNI
jgi:hypothetical protein